MKSEFIAEYPSGAGHHQQQRCIIETVPARAVESIIRMIEPEAQCADDKHQYDILRHCLPGFIPYESATKADEPAPCTPNREHIVNLALQ